MDNLESSFQRKIKDFEDKMTHYETQNVHFDALLGPDSATFRGFIKSITKQNRQTLILNLSSPKIKQFYKSNSDSSYKITSKTVRQYLFYLINEPQKISLNLKASQCMLHFQNPEKCESALKLLQDCLKVQMTKPSGFSTICAHLMNKIFAGVMESGI